MRIVQLASLAFLCVLSACSNGVNPPTATPALSTEAQASQGKQQSSSIPTSSMAPSSSEYSSQAISSSSSQEYVSSSSLYVSAKVDTSYGITRDSLLAALGIQNWPASNEDTWLALWDSLLKVNPDTLLAIPVDTAWIPKLSEMGANWCEFPDTLYNLIISSQKTVTESSWSAEAWDANLLTYSKYIIQRPPFLGNANITQCNYKGVHITYYNDCPEVYHFTFPDQTELCYYPRPNWTKPYYLIPEDGACPSTNCPA